MNPLRFRDSYLSLEFLRFRGLEAERCEASDSCTAVLEVWSLSLRVLVMEAQNREKHWRVGGDTITSNHISDV